MYTPVNPSGDISIDMRWNTWNTNLNRITANANKILGSFEDKLNTQASINLHIKLWSDPVEFA